MIYSIVIQSSTIHPPLISIVTWASAIPGDPLHGVDDVDGYGAKGPAARVARQGDPPDLLAPSALGAITGLREKK